MFSGNIQEGSVYEEPPCELNEVQILCILKHGVYSTTVCMPLLRACFLCLQAAAPTLEEGDKALQQSEIDAYNQLKLDLQLWTLAFSALGLSCTFALTSQV